MKSLPSHRNPNRNLNRNPLPQRGLRLRLRLRQTPAELTCSPAPPTPTAGVIADCTVTTPTGDYSLAVLDFVFAGHSEFRLLNSEYLSRYEL